jgi:sodium-coupled monocarboxylate transporter 8/12
MSSTLSRIDLAVIVAYMLLLLGAGVYFTRQKKTLKTFLLADQNVHWIVVGISVLAALFSGISYLGAPAEAFFHDLRYLLVIGAFCIATPITTVLFVPFFRNLKIYTAYEYFELRFDRRIRWIASSLFILRVTLYLALATYAPALAIMEVAGLPFWVSVLLTGTIATVYTALGGMKAVIITDTMQFLVLCGGIFVIVGFAMHKVPGGIATAWHLAEQDGKTRLLDFSFDPIARITVWAALLGGTCFNLIQLVTDQISVQRYLTAPSLRETKRALWLKFWATLPLIGTFYLTGTLLYGFYRALPERTPNFTNAQLVPALARPGGASPTTAIENDRLLPYFITHELPPPLPGLLIAAILGATIAVVSAGVNALATAALLDFRRNSLESVRSERGLVRAARLLTVLFGVIATLLALFVIPYFPALIPAIIMIGGVFGGPLLGLFFLGVLLCRANSAGAMFGAAAGLISGILLAQAPKWFHYPISFLWIPFCSSLATFVAGWMVSLLFPAPVLGDQTLVLGNAARRREREIVHSA